MMKNLLRNVFGGSPSRAVQCLLDGAPLGAEELARIRQVILEAEVKLGRKEGAR